MANAELAALAADLRRESRVTPEVRKVVRKASDNIKDMWKRLYKASEVYYRATSYPASITKDVGTRGAWIEGEIGPDKGRRQGPLGNLIEFGSINNDPQKEGERALRYHTPPFIASLRQVADIDL